jgi:hypothetical protein
MGKIVGFHCFASEIFSFGYGEYVVNLLRKVALACHAFSEAAVVQRSVMHVFDLV